MGLRRSKQFTWDATARAHDRVYSELRLTRQSRKLCVDEQGDEPCEIDAPPPPEAFASTGRIADEVMKLGRSSAERRVASDVVSPLETDICEGLLDEILDRVALAGGDDVI